MKAKRILIIIATALVCLSAFASCNDEPTKEESTSHEHTVVVDEAVAPTCTETGLTEGNHCSACGEVMQKQEELAALEHDWNGAHTCTACGETLAATEGLEFRLTNSDKEYMLYGMGSAKDKDIVIPATYQGKPVTKIDDRAFVNRGSITSVRIPEGVQYIGTLAFENCSMLTSIVIPSSVTYIGGDAFSGCTKLLTTVDGVVYLGDYAYSCEPSVTAVTLREGTVSILTRAFSDSNLESIIIPDSVTHIGAMAFSDCNKLCSITLPQSVSYISASTFSGCLGLTEFTIPSTVTHIGDSAFSHCDRLTSITIPDTVIELGSSAFSACYGLIDIKIGNSLESIGDFTFSGCYSATSITIGNAVKTIGYNAFSNCGALTSIDIPDSVTVIDEWAFSSCHRLETISIPASVTSIGAEAFSTCYELTNITYRGTKAQWKQLEKGTGWSNDTALQTVRCTDGTLDRNGNEITAE